MRPDWEAIAHDLAARLSAASASVAKDNASEHERLLAALHRFDEFVRGRPDPFSATFGAGRGSGRMSDVAGELAELALSHHAGRTEQLLDALSVLADAARAECDDGTPATLSDAVAASDKMLAGDVWPGDRVLAALVGTGKVWPEGVHIRRGTVVKDGQTPQSMLVALDEPIGSDEVVNVPALLLRRLSS